MLVEAFIAEAAVEGLDIRVLRRLARRDQSQREAALVRPGEQGAPAELGAIVRAAHLWESPAGGELLQHPRDRTSSEGPRRHNRDRLGRGVIHDGQALQHPALGGAIKDEVGGPDLIDAPGAQRRLTVRQGTFLRRRCFTWRQASASSWPSQVQNRT